MSAHTEREENNIISLVEDLKVSFVKTNAIIVCCFLNRFILILQRTVIIPHTLKKFGSHLLMFHSSTCNVNYAGRLVKILMALFV